MMSVEIDENQISQVINNLIINASQAMPKGGIIKICVENVLVEEGDNLPLEYGKYVKLSIQDQGMGIPKEHLHTIFDPYFTTKEKGTGLGLAISYSIIKKHEGYILVESVENVGTTFSIYLPISQREIFKVNEIAEEGIFYGRGKILLMDDQESVLDIVREMLNYIGYEVECAGTGDEAIDMYKKAMNTGCAFDAVIADLTIPGGIGGDEVAKRLQEIDPKVKAIVSSGYSNDPVMSDYENYGFSGFVAKPFALKELSRTLHEVLARA